MRITIAHTKGGVGKSTLAWQLAHSFENTNVTIIDLDFQQTIHYINLMGGSPLNVIQPKTSEELITTLNAIPKQDIVIIDVGGFDNDINRTALEYSDKIIIPISPDSITEFIGFDTFKSIMQELDIHAEICMVLTNVHPFTRNFETIREMIDGLDIRLMETVVRSRKIFKSSMGQGKSVFEYDQPTAQAEIIGVRDEATR